MQEDEIGRGVSAVNILRAGPPPQFIPTDRAKPCNYGSGFGGGGLVFSIFLSFCFLSNIMRSVRPCVFGIRAALNKPFPL